MFVNKDKLDLIKDELFMRTALSLVAAQRLKSVSSATTKDEAGAQNLKTNDDADAFSHVS